LYRRIQKNPRHYAVGKEDNQTWEDRIDDLVMQSVTKLQQTELVKYAGEENGNLESTEYGDIMSKVCSRTSLPAIFLTQF
jgi:ATP-dependent DNA helicase HFM1/MER3